MPVPASASFRHLLASAVGTSPSSDYHCTKQKKNERCRKVSRSGGRIRVAIAVIVALLVIAGGILATLLRVFPPTRHSGEEFGIIPYTSPNDSDHDGVDDQSDILASARAYVATSPRYESAYFDVGRPTDGTGVCTDVVDQALLGAGFDLRALVDEDIRSAPDAYAVDTPDPNIDFRRVRNLRVWFDRHATSLTLDPHEIDEWQGGDIVCWENHIGIVSDMRNADGVALVIHHWGPWQTHFEEDALEAVDLGPIVGHWRLG